MSVFRRLPDEGEEKKKMTDDEVLSEMYEKEKEEGRWKRQLVDEIAGELEKRMTAKISGILEGAVPLINDYVHLKMNDTPKTSKELCESASFPILLNILTGTGGKSRKEYLEGAEKIIGILQELNLSHRAAIQFLKGVEEELGRAKIGNYIDLDAI